MRFYPESVQRAFHQRTLPETHPGIGRVDMLERQLINE